MIWINTDLYYSKPNSGHVCNILALVSEDPSSLPDVTTCTNTSSPDLSLKGPSSSSLTLVKLHTHREHFGLVTKKLRATTAARLQRVRQQLAVVRMPTPLFQTS